MNGRIRLERGRLDWILTHPDVSGVVNDVWATLLTKTSAICWRRLYCEDIEGSKPRLGAHALQYRVLRSAQYDARVNPSFVEKDGGGRLPASEARRGRAKLKQRCSLVSEITLFPDISGQSVWTMG